MDGSKADHRGESPDSELVWLMPDDELRALAEIIAKWIEPATGLKQVYLFGSRVRGDDRPDSDVDLRLPGPLALHP
jgi:hypothetical protein